MVKNKGEVFTESFKPQQQQQFESWKCCNWKTKMFDFWKKDVPAWLVSQSFRESFPPMGQPVCVHHHETVNLVWKENGACQQILVQMHNEIQKPLRPGLWKATEVLVLTRGPYFQFLSFNFWCISFLAERTLNFQGCWMCSSHESHWQPHKCSISEILL